MQQEKKKCIKCQKIMSLDCFYISHSTKGGYTNTCKDCARQYGRKYAKIHSQERLEYHKRYRKLYPEKIRKWARERSRERIKILQEKIKKLKLEFGGKCKLCGYSKNLNALVFHHRNPKEKKFSLSMNRWVKYDVLRKEAEKCDLICANCHYILHHEESYKDFQKWHKRLF